MEDFFEDRKKRMAILQKAIDSAIDNNRIALSRARNKLILDTIDRVLGNLRKSPSSYSYPQGRHTYRSRYENYCWSCRSYIDDSMERCPRCHWFICEKCHACGCGYLYNT